VVLVQTAGTAQSGGLLGEAMTPRPRAPVLSWLGGDRSLFDADRDSACVTKSAGSPSQRHAIRNDCRRRPVSMGPNDLRVLHATQFAPWLDLGAHDDIGLSEVGANAIVGRVW